LAETVDEHGDQVNVALKLMKKDVSDDVFAAEADLMGLLAHPNLVQLLEVGKAFGRSYIAMEFFIGGDLRNVLEIHRRKMVAIPVPVALHLLLEILKGLAYFHGARTRTGTPLNLIHSDVNPSNVYFSGHGDVKLGDYGVASSSHVNIGPGEGIAAGKLTYLSPEQTRGETLTGASDVWAVGVMMHELIVGYHPFLLEDATEAQTIASIRSAKLQIPDYVERPLASILQRALAAEMKGRFRTAGEMAGPLLTFVLDNHLQHNRDSLREWLGRTLELVT
jgi:eukaryotic-like serine/threonine-protein kinase